MDKFKYSVKARDGFLNSRTIALFIERINADFFKELMQSKFPSITFCTSDDTRSVNKYRKKNADKTKH